jgi:hypothetical protein
VARKIYCEPTFQAIINGTFLDAIMPHITQADLIIVKVEVAVLNEARWCQFFNLWGAARELRRMNKKLMVSLGNDQNSVKLGDICF